MRLSLLPFCSPVCTNVCFKVKPTPHHQESSSPPPSLRPSPVGSSILTTPHCSTSKPPSPSPPSIPCKPSEAPPIAPRRRQNFYFGPRPQCGSSSLSSRAFPYPCVPAKPKAAAAYLPFPHQYPCPCSYHPSHLTIPKLPLANIHTIPG